MFATREEVQALASSFLRGTGESGELQSASMAELLPNEVTLLQTWMKRFQRRRMEEASTGSRAVSSTGLGSVNSPSGNVDSSFVSAHR